ncbi:hypothetical protein CBL_13080 [Carabus blaptoides fortunei]
MTDRFHDGLAFPRAVTPPKADTGPEVGRSRTVPKGLFFCYPYRLDDNKKAFSRKLRRPGAFAVWPVPDSSQCRRSNSVVASTDAAVASQEMASSHRPPPTYTPYFNPLSTLAKPYPGSLSIAAHTPKPSTFHKI